MRKPIDSTHSSLENNLTHDQAWHWNTLPSNPKKWFKTRTDQGSEQIRMGKPSELDSEAVTEPVTKKYIKYEKV